jgi:hypothetical protein
MPVSAANRINGGIFQMMRFLYIPCVVTGILRHLDILLRFKLESSPEGESFSHSPEGDNKLKFLPERSVRPVFLPNNWFFGISGRTFEISV